MRFHADGPDIPDELLDARDEGQVIFFCGAGVSRAEAGGPSFLELAARVMDKLGSLEDSPARQLLAFSGKVKPIRGVSGFPPADRIFSLLDDEFPQLDVRRAVAEALEPTPGHGLGPHASLIDLSRAPNGIVRLVTTNFDRVFEEVDGSVPVVAPPLLPDPAQAVTMDGIIYLHGKVTRDYRDQEGPELVLSAADFGRAYLSDGWATNFMRSLMPRYRIVFVGYSADDPPMQYLLEALRPAAGEGQLYAFQEGDASAATGLWRHKGVTAIPFQGFPNLWQTLGLWAERARDPTAWRAGLARKAEKGPRELQPFERGQVAHLVSSAAGAALFANHEPPAPAEWLCAFDPLVRFDRRRPLGWGDPEDRFDPFQAYHLDGEVPPETDEKGKRKNAAPPAGSWSAFEAVPDERPGARSQHVPSLRGAGAVNPLELPPRLYRLGQWLGKVAADPFAIWWAAGQSTLHHDVVYWIRNALGNEGVTELARSAWRLILTAFDDVRDAGDDHLYELDRRIKAEGWSGLDVLKLVEAERPRLTMSRPLTAPIVPAESIFSVVHPDVRYPEAHPELDVPAEHLLSYVDGVRRNLFLATQLEMEVGGFAFSNLQPLNPYPRGPNEFSATLPDISLLMRRYSRLVLQLYDVAPDLAVREVAGWHGEVGPPFRNLAVWAGADRRLTTPADVAATIDKLGEDIWERDLERDLLKMFEARWAELEPEVRQRVEAMFLAGPQPWEDVDLERFGSYRTHSALRRLFWLDRARLPVSFDLPAEMSRLRSQLADWDPEDAADALDGSSSRGGMVATNRSYSALLDVALDQTMAEAEAQSGRSRDFLVENRPFKGLVEERPVRAFAALRRAAALGEAWHWGWSDFMWAEARAKDPVRLRCYVARRIAELGPAILNQSLRAIAHWFTAHAEPIWHADRSLYLATWTFLVRAIERKPEAADSSVVVEGAHDWLTESINSPPGRLADQLFDELSWAKVEGPEDDWLARAGRLLALPPGPMALAAVQFTLRLNWFFAHRREWTEAHLLPLLRTGEGSADVADAAVTGFLRQRYFPKAELLAPFVPMLVRLFVEERSSRRHGSLESLVLGAWFKRGADGERLLGSAAFRHALVATSEQQRLAVLRLLGRWMGEDEDTGAQVVEFIRDVWPRQLAARSPTASTALVELALGARQRLPEVTSAVLPIIETSNEPIEALPFVRRREKNQVSDHPCEHLSLFYAILPQDAALWPWGMTQVIEQLASIDMTKDDPRLIELRRRAARL